MGPDNDVGPNAYRAEVLVKGDSQWRVLNGTFPSDWPVYSQTGITMNNKVYFSGIVQFVHTLKKVFIFIEGGWNIQKYFDHILEFDTVTETWSMVGRMKAARGRPGVSVVNLDDVLDYTTDCVDMQTSS